jgi:hypothetical protein
VFIMSWIGSIPWLIDGTRALEGAAAHTVKPIASIAAATANSLILRISVLPCISPRRCSSHLTGRTMPDHGFGRCDGYHEMVEFRVRGFRVRACVLLSRGVQQRRSGGEKLAERETRGPQEGDGGSAPRCNDGPGLVTT